MSLESVGSYSWVSFASPRGGRIILYDWPFGFVSPSTPCCCEWHRGRSRWSLDLPNRRAPYSATYPAVHDLLTTPGLAYAGAFVFGLTRTEKRVDPEARKPSTHATERCRASSGSCSSPTIIPDISWEEYQANTARLRGNWRRPRDLAGGAVREGRALLQGLLRRGRCRRIMQTSHFGAKGNCPRYVCARAKQMFAGEHVCLGRTWTSIFRVFTLPLDGTWQISYRPVTPDGILG